MAAPLCGRAQVIVQGIQPLDRFQAEQERLRKLMESRPAPYEDKVMDATSLPPASDTSAPPSADAEGVRSIVSETRMGTTQSESGLELRRATELGHRLEYRRETLNFGDYSLSADVRATSGDTALTSGAQGSARERKGGRLTLRSIGLPITERLFADTSAGDISSEVTSALGRAYRVSLGSGTVRGVSTRVFNATSDLRAGYGLRGSLAGGPYPGFERNQGELAWAGYSHRFDNGVRAGMQVARATEVPSYTFTVPFDATATTDVTSLAAALGYGADALRPGGHRGRVILVRSQSGDSGAAQGIYLEGALRVDNMRHEFGAYQADPGLRYAEQPLNGDVRGAYWRMDASSLRLSWGLGLDVEEQNPHQDPTRVHRRSIGLSANAQYRIDRDRYIGASFTTNSARHSASFATTADFGSGSRSVNGSAFYQTRLAPRWGTTTLRATLRRNEVLVANGVPATGEEVEWQQDWITGRYESLRPEFATTLGVARDRSEGKTETRPTAGVKFRLWPDAEWSVGGSLRYTSVTGNLSTSRGLSGTLETEKALADGWSLGASVSLNQATVDTSVASVAAPLVSRTNDKSASIYLRWEDTRGAPFEGAGLRAPGSVGAGGIGGVVYFDANRDGEQQLGEAGVPNVEVFLDGRYRVSTDRNGRFDFPLVGTGRHQLTLTLETVPLPWGAASDQAVAVEVPLRGQATVRIPVVRVGD